ncbi:hypothetical protein CLOL250_02198 [Clostridium sp. L2-50]|nr:hypothetical protein CLOL250_02198 [Clostridium sp. L2-50]
MGIEWKMSARYPQGRLDEGIRKNVGGKYPTKLNKFGMKTKKQVRYPMVAYNRGYKCENIEIIPMIREALFHRLTL